MAMYFDHFSVFASAGLFFIYLFVNAGATLKKKLKRLQSPL